jgi:NTE family protein
VDLKTGREVILKDGNVADALLATIAIPGVFPAREWGDYQLADGGVLDPVPVAVSRSLAPKVPAVAVVLSPSPNDWENLTDHPLISPPPALEPISRLRVAQVFEIFIRSIDIGMRTIAELRLQVDQPEVIIRPDVHHIGILDRVNVSEVVKIGEAATEKALPELRKAVHWWGRLRRRFR